MAECIPCGRCGASLQIGPTARFVTCNQCGAELAVQRTSGVVFTEAMSDDDRPDTDVPGAPSLHGELAQLDHAWRLERQQYMIMNRYGRRYVPTPAGSLMVAVTVVGFGAIGATAAFHMTDPRAGRLDPFFILGILVIVLGVVVGTMSYRKARRYQKAYDAYRRRREELLARDEGE